MFRNGNCVHMTWREVVIVRAVVENPPLWHHGLHNSTCGNSIWHLELHISACGNSKRRQESWSASDYLVQLSFSWKKQNIKPLFNYFSTVSKHAHILNWHVDSMNIISVCHHWWVWRGQVVRSGLETLPLWAAGGGAAFVAERAQWPNRVSVITS